MNEKQFMNSEPVIITVDMIMINSILLSSTIKLSVLSVAS